MEGASTSILHHIPTLPNTTTPQPTDLIECGVLPPPSLLCLDEGPLEVRDLPPQQQSIPEPRNTSSGKKKEKKRSSKGKHKGKKKKDKKKKKKEVPSSSSAGSKDSSGHKKVKKKRRNLKRSIEGGATTTTRGNTGLSIKKRKLDSISEPSNGTRNHNLATLPAYSALDIRKLNHDQINQSINPLLRFFSYVFLCFLSLSQRRVAYPFPPTKHNGGIAYSYGLNPRCNTLTLSCLTTKVTTVLAVLLIDAPSPRQYHLLSSRFRSPQLISPNHTLTPHTSLQLHLLSTCQHRSKVQQK